MDLLFTNVDICNIRCPSNDFMIGYDDKFQVNIQGKRFKGIVQFLLYHKMEASLRFRKPGN